MVLIWGPRHLKNYRRRVSDLKRLQNVDGLQLHPVIVSNWCLHKLRRAPNQEPSFTTLRHVMTLKTDWESLHRLRRAMLHCASNHKYAAFCSGPYCVSIHESFCAPSSCRIICLYVQGPATLMAQHQRFGRGHVYCLLVWFFNQPSKQKKVYRHHQLHGKLISLLDSFQSVCPELRSRNKKEPWKTRHGRSTAEQGAKWLAACGKLKSCYRIVERALLSGTHQQMFEWNVLLVITKTLTELHTSTTCWVAPTTLLIKYSGLRKRSNASTVPLPS